MCKAKQRMVGLALLCLLGSAVYGQKKSKHQQFGLFSIEKSKETTDAMVMNTSEMYRLIKQPSEHIQFLMEIDGKKEMISLKKQDILSKNYTLSSSNETISKRTKIHYRGTIENSSSSRVYMTMQGMKLDLQIQKGNRKWDLKPTISTSKKRSYTLKRTIQRKTESIAQCTSTLHDNPPALKSELRSNKTSEFNTASDSKISVYIEVDHAFYLKNNQSMESTENYITSVFAQVAHLYANESIDIEIAGIKIWDTPDPYDISTSENALLSFRSAIGTGFNGNLAHLISGNDKDHGGKAYIDVLCDQSKAFGYSNFQGSNNESSDFSWDVFLLTHEIGHNFGSSHTHDCVWGPNEDMALDHCYTPEESCAAFEELPEVGTIMSYCHITDIGVSFEAGFGKEPGDLIRSRYNACYAEEGINCASAIELKENGRFQVYGPVTGYGASQTSADHAVWYKYTPHEDGKIKILSCQSDVDTRLWIHTGICDELLTIANSDDDCGLNSDKEYSSFIPYLEVQKDETLYFEWDDRWSDDGFEFWFKYSPFSVHETSETAAVN